MGLPGNQHQEDEGGNGTVDERRSRERSCAVEEEESASLVRREALPDVSWPQLNRSTSTDELPHEEEDEKLLIASRFHEELLHQAGGHGAFQRFALVMCGVGLASDAVEVFAVSYILPSAERELCLEECHKGWFGIASLVGMLIGGFVWGTLGDHLGRRRALLSALSTNAVFGVVAAFMPTFHLFLVTRLCSGIGIGGSLPVVFTYFSEFLVRKRRGHHLGMLLLFWAAGGIFVALLAWEIVPRTGASLMDFKQLHFGQWRVFLLACSLPAMVSVVGIAFLPESPRFLLEMGRSNEALYVYRKIFATNNSSKSGVEYQLTEMELPGKCSVRPVLIPSNRGFILTVEAAAHKLFQAYVQMLSSPYLQRTTLLLIVWASLSFGFYGLTVYFPAYTDHLKAAEFDTRALKEFNSVIGGIVYNSTLENIQFSNSSFLNVRFNQMLISHSSFHGCLFWNCTFSDVRSSRSYFSECDFVDTVFIDTDLYEYKFQSCSLNNTFFYSTKGGCDIDFDIRFNLSDLFFKNLFAQISIFLGTFASSFLLDRFGRVRTMGVSLFVAAASVCFFWLIEEKRLVMLFESVFSFVCVCGWNALDVLSTETYPAHIRATSYGFLTSVSRLSAILGNIVFSGSVNCPRVVPIVTGVAALLAGAVCTNHIPETKDYLL